MSDSVWSACAVSSELPVGYQVTVRATRSSASLTWEPPSAYVRWRPLPSVVIVTHLVTRSLMSRCQLLAMVWNKLESPRHRSWITGQFRESEFVSGRI